MLADDLKTRIKKSGPLSFSEFVESCLYDPNDGFYTKGGGAGRRGRRRGALRLPRRRIQEPRQARDIAPGARREPTRAARRKRKRKGCQVQAQGIDTRLAV